LSRSEVRLARAEQAAALAASSGSPLVVGLGDDVDEDEQAASKIETTSSGAIRAIEFLAGRDVIGRSPF
jgi:hypothetical protein